MKNILLILNICLFLMGCSLPKPTYNDFEGKIIYSITQSENVPNNLVDSSNYQVIYAKDSMLRIDNFTPLGKQIYIEHIPKKKAYILMTLGTQKIAVQTPADTTQHDNSYIFEYQSGSKTFSGIKAKNIMVTVVDLDTTITMNYYPEISPKYSTSMKGMPGLPVNYSLFSQDNWVTFQLISFEKKKLNIDLFGIPSDYKIITLNEFIEIINEE